MESCKHNDLNSICPRCESHFHCSCKDGCKYCWCFDLPKINIPEDFVEEECLCPKCMNDLYNSAKDKHEEIKKYR